MKIRIACGFVFIAFVAYRMATAEPFECLLGRGVEVTQLRVWVPSCGARILRVQGLGMTCVLLSQYDGGVVVVETGYPVRKSVQTALGAKLVQRSFTHRFAETAKESQTTASR